MTRMGELVMSKTMSVKVVAELFTDLGVNVERVFTRRPYDEMEWVDADPIVGPMNAHVAADSSVFAPSSLVVDDSDLRANRTTRKFCLPAFRDALPELARCVEVEVGEALCLRQENVSSKVHEFIMSKESAGKS